MLARRLRSMVSLSPPSYLRPARPGLALEFDERPDGVAYTSVHGSLEVYLAPQELWNALLDFEGGPLTTEGLALPDRILPLSEVVTLWKTGLLMEGRPTSDRLIEPEDLFRVVPELPVHERILFSEAGQASVQLGFGVTQITFDEPDLLNFGRSLYTHRLGFLASEAPSWSGRSWERSVELLESLLAMGLLERM